MINLPLASSPVFPVEVTLVDGTTPLTGKTVALRMVSLDNGLQVDFDDYSLGNTDSSLSMTALAQRAYSYVAGVQFGSLARGHYKAIASVTENNQLWEYEEDFALGMYSRFALGFSAVYTPGTANDSGLKLTLWLDEDGQRATDPTAFNSVQVLDNTGTLLASLGNATTGSGVGALTGAVTLLENTQYVLSCGIVVPVVGGTKTIPCWVGIVRP